MTISLSALNAGTCQDADINRLSKHVMFFAVRRSTTAGESPEFVFSKPQPCLVPSRFSMLSEINRFLLW